MRDGLLRIGFAPNAGPISSAPMACVARHPSWSAWRHDPRPHSAPVSRIACPAEALVDRRSPDDSPRADVRGPCKPAAVGHLHRPDVRARRLLGHRLSARRPRDPLRRARKLSSRLSTTPVFLRALGNTFVYAAIVIPFGVFLALGVALLVYGRKRSRAFWEVAYFLPVTATLVAMATVWQFLLHPSLGPVNAAIKALGFEPVAFLSNPVAAHPDHGADRHLADPRLQHGAVPRRAHGDPEGSLRGGAARRCQDPDRPVFYGDMADARADDDVRRRHHLDLGLQGVRDGGGADQGPLRLGNPALRPLSGGL